MNFDLYLNLPLIVVAVGSLAVLLLDVFMVGKLPSYTASIVILLGGLICTVMVAPEYLAEETAFSGLLFVDPFTSLITALILAGSVLCLLMGKDYLEREGVGEAKGEFSSLYLMTIAGAILFVSAAEFITLFVGLELMSMALYALCGAALYKRESSESALKYFFLGSFSSAFLLMGIALLYGATGSLSLIALAAELPAAPTGVISIGVGLILLGILFKIGAVPLHFWAPDVYQGAPTPVTLLMASVIKIAGVCVGMRVLWLTFGGADYYELWAAALWVVAALTIIVGNIIAVRQRSIKRMLAYSSIAHAGYMLMGFLAPGEYGGGAAVMFYLVAYTVMTLGAFGVVMAVSSPYMNQPDSDDITRFNHLGDRSPYLAALLSLFLFSLAGLPPGMAGLLGKFYVFNAVVQADYVGLAILGVIGSAISCYYYLRVVVAMYFIPAEEADGAALPVELSMPLVGTLTVCAIATVMLGLQPSELHTALSALFHQ